MDELLERLLEKSDEFVLLKQLVTLEDVANEIKAMGWRDVKHFLSEVEFAEPIVSGEVQTTNNTRTVKGAPLEDLVGTYIQDPDAEVSKSSIDVEDMSSVTVPVFQLVHNTVYIERFTAFKDKDGKVWIDINYMG